MESQYNNLRTRISHDLIQVFMRFGLVALIVVVCARIFAPFAPIMLWGLVLAVSLYPLHEMIKKRLGVSAGKAATIQVLVALILIGTPTVMLGLSFADHAGSVYSDWSAGTLTIQPPAESVKTWPVVGERVYAAWSEAASNLPAFLKEHDELLRRVFKGAVGAAGDTLATVALFLGAVVIAGVMMAYGESGDVAMRRVARTLAGGDEGEKMHELSIGTIRSVATGVVGVSFIQALLMGVGFMIAGVPGAGVLALISVFTGIMQLPAFLVTLPALAWIWGAGDGSVVFDSIITVYIVAAGLADNVLKPMLLGRGVDVPMPVVMLGALGGMVALGLIGLFLGSVVLGVGYQLFMAWVDRECKETCDDPDQSGDTPVTSS